MPLIHKVREKLSTWRIAVNVEGDATTIMRAVTSDDRRRGPAEAGDAPAPDAASLARLRPAQRRRYEGIVRRAADLFLADGIAGVKMTDVAQASGVGVATVYRYFGTKTNVAIAACTLLWREFRDAFATLGAPPEALATASGLDRMRDVLERAVRLYLERPEFIALLDEFDATMIAEHVDRARLAGYAAQVDSFYDACERVFRAGVADGSIRADVDFPLFYRAATHALAGIAEKLVRGEILPSDDFSDAEREIACVVDMATAYLAPSFAGVAASGRKR